MVQAVPVAIAGALGRKTYYFVPLALSDRRGGEATLVAPAYTPSLATRPSATATSRHDGTEGVFISTRLLGDRFALAFEFFINIGHAFVDVIGVPEAFDQLVWSQALADVRGETSQDAWESRNLSLASQRQGRQDRRQTGHRRESAEQLSRIRLLGCCRHLPAFALGRLRLLRASRTRVSTSRPAGPGRPASPRRPPLPAQSRPTSSRSAIAAAPSASDWALPTFGDEGNLWTA